jgi:hypothetical protein
MAGRGPAPQAKKRRRNADPTPGTKVVRDNRTRGPRLPADCLPDGEVWHPRTRAWWTSWRKSPQAAVFTPTDWDFLLDTALMHHTMWSKGRWEFASEVRLRVAKFGATIEDRARLRLEVESPAAARRAAAAARPATGEAAVTSLASRRARLMS